MAHRCKISGVSRQHGHRVSHANNKRKHVFKANIQSKRLFIPELGRYVRLKVSTQTLRTIDKIGVAEALRKNGLSIEKVIGKTQRKALEDSSTSAR